MQKCHLRLTLILAMALPTLATAPATAQSKAPVSERFAGQDLKEVPDFQKHVVPLLGRLGCNGRACHGSFQGRGGFRLSLFGYDFKMDHTALTARASSGNRPRANRQTPDKSLALLKPLMAVDHEGGERFEKGSWEHRLLRQWIASGAKGVTRPKELLRLEVHPKEVVFSKSQPSAKLRVTAVWHDGTKEDVTPLCRFRSNDDSVVTVDRDGSIQSLGPGDSHVVAFYDNGVAAIPVMRPLSATGQDATKLTASTKIDELVHAKLNKLGIRPSAVCTDAEFLRRLSIDLTGTLPKPAEVEAFLADKSSNKRALKISEVLKRPAYAAWWTNKLCDFTGCNPRQQAELGQETSVQWYMWIYQRVRSNMPYDELVERIVLSKSRRKEQTYDEYATETSSYFREESPADFAGRETMPHYWTRRTMTKPEDKALAFAQNFLGIRLQCAQCHKHPFAPWTQRDFREFGAMFETVKFGLAPGTEKRYRQLAQQVGLRVRGNSGSPVRKDVLRRAQEGRTVPWRELYISRRTAPKTLGLLRSGNVELQADDDPRRHIMKWIKSKDNPWFARAFVNRVWAGYFHVGIIHPTDDLNPANPPSNPELLNWLTTGFIRSGYDMQWLHRQIVSSDAYQRSWRPNETNRNDRRNFSRAIPRRIPAEVVYDGLKQAVARSDKLTEVRTDLTRRATGHLSMWLAGTYGMHVFGKPERALNCDCERVNQPTLLQSIFMQNDPLVEQRIDGSGWIEEIAEAEKAGKPLKRDALIRTVWLRTVGRPPTSSERDRAKKHLAENKVLAEGVRDLLWALVNTKEFILNH